MRLLFVTPQAPWPPAQGTTLRNFHLLKAAASQHVVDLLTFGEHTPPELSVLCRAVHVVPQPLRSSVARLRDLAFGHADMERRLWSPSFAARLEQLLHSGSYDAVQLEGFEVAAYLLGPAALRREARDDSRRLPFLIFDDHNAEYRLQQSAARIDATDPRKWPRAAYSLVQARRLRRREALYVCAADLSIAVSREDASALTQIAPGVTPLVVPNGVDCASFPPPAPSTTPTIFFAGKLDYRPNVDACEWLVKHILPLVQPHVPHLKVILAGRDPSSAVRHLAGPAVEVTGALDDVALASLRSRAWVYAVPMRMGSGVRFKTLEAMAARIPVVSTPLGASGSGAIDGRHALLADDAGSFAAALVRALTEPDLRRSLTAAARALAEREHDWSHITPRLLAAFRHLARPRATSVSVLATVLNECQNVPRLARSLGAQTRAPEDIVVVDGGSTDGTPGALHSELPAARVDVLPGANISAGRNRAVRLAAHPVVAATDAGVDLHPRWLELITKPLEETGAEVQAASGFFVSAPQSTWELALGATTLPDVAEIDPTRFLPSSRSLAFRRDAWQAAGAYPEWLDYCEDLVFDLALIARCGRPRFAPRAVARFRPRTTPTAFFVQYYRYARGDGKADLWRKRHIIRYVTYAAGSALSWRVIRRGDPAAALALLVGGAAYLKTPFARLSNQAETLRAFVSAASLVPFVRLTGDVAKMLGYPVGILWRLRNRASD